MKKALHKDFRMEIKKTRARFISIFCIVALGVAFFSGIQASSPDMRLSGDAYYTENKMMDLKVMGTLGLTDKDVEAVRNTEGVEWAEGAFSTDVLCGEADAQKVLHVESVNEDVNGLTVTEGSLPKKSGECFLDVTFAKGMGYKLGDQIELREDTEDPLLKTKTYTITGLGRTPLYISFNRGNTTLGSGEVNGFVYVLPEDFEQDIYTQIYIRAHGTQQVTSYTDAYDSLIKRLTEHVEGIQEERCQVRYDEIISEAEEKLADAEKELEEGKEEADKELADAKKELEDGEKEYADGLKEYEDGKKQLADAKTQIADAKNQSASAAQTISEGWSQIASAKEELNSGWNEINAGKKELEKGLSQFNKAQKKLDKGWNEYNSGKKEFDAGAAQLEAAKTQLSQGKQKIEEGKKQLDAQQQQITEGITLAQAGITEIDAQIAQLNGQIPQLEEGIKSAGEAAANLPALLEALTAAQEGAANAQTAVDTAQAALGEAMGKLEAGEITEEELVPYQEALGTAQAQLEAANGAVAQTQAAVDACNAAAAKKAELEAALTAVKDGMAQAEAKKTELNTTIASLQAGQAAIDQGRETLAAEEAKFPAAEKEIAANEQKLAASEKTLNESLAALKSGQAELDANKKVLDSSKAELDAGIQKLNAGAAEINANEQKLISGEAELEAGQQKIAEGEAEIKTNEQKLTDAKAELKDAKEKLEDGWKEYKDGEKEAKEEIEKGEKEIEDARKEIEEIEKPEWLITDRNDLPEYSDYGDNADRIKNIGEVFPVIFFLVAALISLTTMTRMVEEQRTQIGTLKALGYGKYAIASKYLNYAFLATVGGSAAGILIGEKILPYIIIKAYGIMYHNVGNSLQIHYELKFALTASLAAIVCTVGATVVSCYKVLSETPASLMRPPAPKEGKRVLVERITILWKHLNFSWKSCLRNLFRYKKRLFMTIFGISGSMALMLVGFGIKDSISDIVVKQYEELQHYDGTIITDEDATEEQREELREYLKQNSKIERATSIQFTKIMAPGEKSNISIYLYVPQNMESFRQDVTLRNRITREAYELTDEGAVISEKTAKLLNLQVGDDITLEKDHTEYKAKVAVITENYMGHYVYMTPLVYEKTFGEKPVYEDMIFSVKEEYLDQAEEIGRQILSQPAALSISYTSSLAAQVDRMLSTLGIVIVVLIVSAGMLAFVVLYNLNNINITERQRELATLKVLGFYDKEVSQYVLRENILLTIAGIIFGSGFGVLLHRYIIVTVEVDAVMFGRNIRPVSFLYCAVITCIFSVVVNLFMHWKLKKIDMVESLKSVE